MWKRAAVGSLMIGLLLGACTRDPDIAQSTDPPLRSLQTTTTAPPTTAPAPTTAGTRTTPPTTGAGTTAPVTTNPPPATTPASTDAPDENNKDEQKNKKSKNKKNKNKKKNKKIKNDRTNSPADTGTISEQLGQKLGVADYKCVVQVQPGEGLSVIADRFDDDTVTPGSIMRENSLATEVLDVDQLLDVCVGNGLDDVEGAERDDGESKVVNAVTRQQKRLNKVFAGTGIPELLIDGISGPVTRQRLCAFRVANDLPVSTKKMKPGSAEHKLLMKTDKLKIPYTSALNQDRWVLIDKTCQIAFIGRGADQLDFVMPVSTGEAEFPTRPQDQSDVFKYDSASDNGGWHDSTDYPSAEDNPLNGNMYRPLYFDGGQAIHGANNVPRSPASKGCVRLRVGDMDTVIEWLGLGGVTGATYDNGLINLNVNVQGEWQGT